MLLLIKYVKNISLAKMRKPYVDSFVKNALLPTEPLRQSTHSVRETIDPFIFGNWLRFWIIGSMPPTSHHPTTVT